MTTEAPTPTEPPRRGILTALTSLLLALPILGPLVFAGSVVLRRSRRRAPREIDTLPLAEIPEDGVRRFRLRYRRQHGAFVEQVERIVYLRRDGDGVIALSAECTHLACNVHHDPEAERFVCPCHKGVFDLDGRVESGPPPSALRRFTATVPADRAKPVTLRV